MKKLLEHIKKKLIKECKDCIDQERVFFPERSVKESSIILFNENHKCFTDLFDTEEEVLQWLEDEKMI